MIVGGVGRLPGAVLGALLIGIVEALTASLPGSQMRDVGVFVVLMAALAVRTNGLLRVAASR